jgi:hypothetical protein
METKTLCSNILIDRVLIAVGKFYLVHVSNPIYRYTFPQYCSKVTLGKSNFKHKLKVKLSRYTPWWRLGGDEA